jgi:hypothetical protein
VIVRTTQSTCRSPSPVLVYRGKEGGREEDDGWNQHVAHVGFEECAGDAGGSREVAKPGGSKVILAIECRRGSPRQSICCRPLSPLFPSPAFPYYPFHELIDSFRCKGRVEKSRKKEVGYDVGGGPAGNNATNVRIVCICSCAPCGKAFILDVPIRWPVVPTFFKVSSSSAARKAFIQPARSHPSGSHQLID